ncbi:MAG: transposase [Spirochaetales bacterium]|nr:transposase [Spirochaetales bacterium]
MIKRHEMSDEQWDRIKDMVPPERSGGKDRPNQDKRMMINAMIRILRSWITKCI